MKTHLVIDTVYTEEEGNQAFAGTLQECNEWVAEQGFGYKVVPMTEEELKNHNYEKESVNNKSQRNAIRLTNSLNHTFN